MLYPLANFPIAAADSVVGKDIDKLVLFLTIVSAFFFILIVGITTYFVIRYRRRSNQPELTWGKGHSTPLELTWSIIPAIIVLIVFFWGFHLFMRLQIAPGDAMEIRVTAQQWSWLFKYPSGVRSDKLVVPIGRPIKLVMSSKDVIHSLFIPDFRVKMDILPYRYTTMWFEPTREATYDLYCAEYCGDAHSAMTTTVEVVSQEAFDAWVAKNSRPPTGQELYTLYGCVACHSLDGTAGIGPTWKGLYDRETTLADDSTVIADDNYLREAILQPQAKVVKGFDPVMPPPSPDMSTDELDSLIDFIKSLKE